MRAILILLAVSGLVLAGCGEEAAPEETETRTISPVTPEVTDDSDPDLSQTLEVGEDRSVNEGADLPGFEEEIRATQEGADQEDLPPSPERSREPDGEDDQNQ